MPEFPLLCGLLNLDTKQLNVPNVSFFLGTDNVHLPGWSRLFLSFHTVARLLHILAELFSNRPPFCCILYSVLPQRQWTRRLPIYFYPGECWPRFRFSFSKYMVGLRGTSIAETNGRYIMSLSEPGYGDAEKNSWSAEDDKDKAVDRKSANMTTVLPLIDRI